MKQSGNRLVIIISLNLIPYFSFILLSKMSEFDRSLAIVIGINDYQNGIDKLKTAVPDAIAIAEILQDTYKYELIHPDFDKGVIVNQYATKDKLKTLLTDILPNKIKPTKGDRLIFYFAGHGIARNSDDEPQGFLVPQDADMKQQDSLLRMRDVHDWLAELECKHLLVILDCCFAGAFRWASYRKLIPIADEITKAHYDRFIRFPAWQVLTSASHNQEALEFLNNRDIELDKKHSPFAAGLIEALQQEKGDLNGDGVIIATELYLYLRDYVEKNAQDRQTPGFFPLKKHDRGEYLFKLPNTPLNLKETPELNKDNNPYRGLEPFEAKHSKLFFGRDEVIEKLSTKVSQAENQLTIVTGISGSGKSSLVKAGLIPYLQHQEQHQWFIFNPIRPGTNPYAAIARVLAQLNGNLSQRTGNTTLSGKQLQNNPHKFISAIQKWSQQNPNSRLLLVIDQFEELITMTPKDRPANKTEKQSWLQKLKGKLGQTKAEVDSDGTEKEAEKWTEFIKLLVEILDKCPQLNLIVTLRSDFEPRFQESAFKSNWASARFLVRPMRSDELREAVEKPAMEKALYFEPPELVDRLVDEVSQMPGALPLLSFTLSEMYIQLYEDWKNEGKEDRALTVTEDFEQKGGVAGALTRRANEEFLNLPSPKKAHRLTMQRVMLRMVELEGGEAVRRRILKSELTYQSDEENKRVETVVAKLQQARLIVTGTDAEADEPYYEPAHDYLVRGWERLQVWITKEQDNLTLQRLLIPTVSAWKKDKDQKDLWYDNSRLDRLQEIKQNNADENWLNASESEFVKKSLTTKKNRRKRTTYISTAIISSLSILSVTAIIFAYQADRQRRIQFSRQLAANSTAIKEQGSDLHEISVLLALEGYKRSYEINKLSRPSSETNAALYSAFSYLPNHVLPSTLESKFSTKEFSPDSQYTVTVSDDETVKLWKISTGEEIKIPDRFRKRKLKVSPDSQYVVAYGSDETVELWKISTGEEIKIPDWTKVEEIKFSPDSRYLATVDFSNTAKIIDINTTQEIIISPRDRFNLNSVTIHYNGIYDRLKFTPDSQYVVTYIEVTH